MFQIDDPTAVAVMPTPEAAGTQGWFTEGDPATSTPATNVRASFLNGLTKELMNLLAEMGATPAKTTYTQVRDAIYGMIAAKSAASLAATGWQKLPSGVIIQWGPLTATSGSGTATFATTFPTACRSVSLVDSNGSGWSSTNLSVWATTAISTSSFSAKMMNWNGAWSVGSGVANYIAIGY